MSRDSPDEVILVDSSSGEEHELIVGIEKSTGNLMGGDIMFGSRTSLCVFDAGIVNVQSNRDEALDVYLGLFWVLWSRITFLWMKMRDHKEFFLLMNFLKKMIFVVTPELIPIVHVWDGLGKSSFRVASLPRPSRS
ncbi:hypothetical protein TNCV_4475141 [Trichonephila clavipes]|nr:hypothetical protein TNCV_4475141 [Trichonephila clavipes]